MVTCAPIACRHKVSGSISLPSRGSFHLSLTVLYAIGHWVVFRLGGWAPRLHTEFLVLSATLVPLLYELDFVYGDFTLFVRTFQIYSAIETMRHECPQPRMQAFGLASFPFARRYLENRCFFLFLRVLRCFSSPRYLLYTYVFSIGYTPITACAFPHSEICG